MKNLQSLTTAAILLTAFSLSGCLHIVEEITLRKDGTGTYRFVVDASEIKKMVGGLGNMGKKEETEPDSTAWDTVVETDTVAPPKKEYEVTAERLATYPGISNAIAVNDTATYTTGYAFEFDNVEFLQAAMIGVGSAASLGSWNERYNMTLSKKMLKRDRGGSTFRDILTQALSERGEQEGRDMSGASGMMKFMFGNLSFEQVYHFPDQKIKNCNHKGAVISKDKHTLRIIEKPFKDSDENQKKAPSELQVKLK